MRYYYELRYELNGKEVTKNFTNSKALKQYIQDNMISKVFGIRVYMG